MSSTFLIVGAQSAMARHTVAQLTQAGHRVLTASRSPQGAAEEHQLFDGDAADQKLDLPEKLDGLAYFPGTITLKPIARLTEEDFLRDYRVNVLGAVSVIQQALPALKKAGQASIVLFSSVAAHTGMGFHASIAAAKAAVEGMGRSLAAELAPGIRVNMIAPSLTDTPLAAPLLSSAEKTQASAERHPLKRIGQPQDVASLVEFLLTDRSQFFTGQVFRPDGGLSSVRLF